MDLSLKPCMNMDKRLKPCTTTTVQQDFCNQSDSDSNGLLVDKLSSLPDELLIQILSLIPTKHAAATCFLSNRLKRVFPFITNLDIDDSPTISHCLEEPNNIHRFPSFVTFVDTALQARQSPYLTRFRLGVGSDLITKYFYRCSKHCLPDVNSTRLYSWISFPFTRCGLKELDLRIHVREPADGHHMPPEIFTCETLEVLKLDVNLSVDQVSTFHLPVLKLLHLYVSHIYGDGSFVARLVSSCPLLEDLTVQAAVPHVQSVIISSTSLRILNLPINTREPDNTDFLLIHTPNLEYFDFSSNLALRQSITNMDRLIKADISIEDLILDEHEASCEQMLSIISCLANVHHLSLLHSSIQDLNFEVVKNQLPVFRNLKYLELGNKGYNYWDKVLVAFFNCSPVLETLVFPQGMIDNIIDKEKLRMEKELCKTGLATIPWCCRFHLKRIVIKQCYGNEREIDLIQFLLKHALVLEELVVYGFEGRFPHFPVVDKMELQTTLQNLPRASVTSSIQVR